MSRSTINERVAVSENDIKGQDKRMDKMQLTLESILSTVDKIENQMARDKGFFAGMCFAYGTIGVLFGGLLTAGFNYLVHKPA